MMKSFQLALWGLALAHRGFSVRAAYSPRDIDIDVEIGSGCGPRVDATHTGFNPHAKKFNIELTWEDSAPDGYTRKTIKMNGQCPGPLLELNQGDDVEVHIKNKTPYNETIHFHGIAQMGTPWSDGVPGLTQRPIPSGGEFIYRWNADSYGSYWYHGHLDSHVADGLYGPILIHPRPDEPSPFAHISSEECDIKAMRKAELKPNIIMVSDYSHFTSEEWLKLETDVDLDFHCMDSVLVNGKGINYCLPQAKINALTNPALRPLLGDKSLTPKACIPPDVIGVQGPYTKNFTALPESFYNCIPHNGSVEVFRVDPAKKWASFNFISASTVDMLTISIDEHPMWVYAIDGRHVVPVKVDALTVPNGGRLAVMVKLDQDPADYTIRVSNPGLNQILFGNATLRYKHGDRGYKSTASITANGQNATVNVSFLNAHAVKPFPAISPAATADATSHLLVTRYGASWKWTLTGKQDFDRSREYDEPLLFNPYSPAGLNENLTITTTFGDWVDIIVQVQYPPQQPPHPIHKHSNKGFLIGFGNGNFTWNTTAEAMKEIPGSFNLVDPPYIDTFVTPSAVLRSAWMVIRYVVENPGAFLMHCHIQTHQAGGMSVAIIDGLDKYPVVPEVYRYGDGIGPDLCD